MYIMTRENKTGSIHERGACRNDSNEEIKEIHLDT